MTTELATVSNSLDYNNPKVLETIKSTVAKDASPEEFQMFLGLCRATGLNPFKKEVWFVKTRQAVQIMTGINGFYEIANRHPQFDGIELEYGEDQNIKAGKTEIVAPSWVEAKVYRKDRSRPQTFRAFWREYAKDLLSSNGYPTIWAKMPSVMLAKCAESMAMRKAFPQELNGLYTQEEMPAEYSLKTPKVIDADEAAVRAEVGSVLPSPKEELETYIVATVGSKYEGSMLCEIDPDYIEKVVTTPKSLSRFTAQDAANLQAYYQQFIRVTYVKKEDQKAKLQKQAEELKGETYVAVEPNSGEVIE